VYARGEPDRRIGGAVGVAVGVGAGVREAVAEGLGVALIWTGVTTLLGPVVQALKINVKKSVR
jgi:hypothetical protein